MLRRSIFFNSNFMSLGCGISRWERYYELLKATKNLSDVFGLILIVLSVELIDGTIKVWDLKAALDPRIPLGNICIRTISVSLPSYIIWGLHHYSATAHVKAYPDPSPAHNCIPSICVPSPNHAHFCTWISRDCRRIVLSHNFGSVSLIYIYYRPVSSVAMSNFIMRQASSS